MNWPSPLDAKELHSDGFALLVDSMCFAYHVQDSETGLNFYMIAFGQHFRLFAMYLPENNLLVARDTQHLKSALRYQTRYRLLFLRHAVHCGSAILAGLRKPPGPVYHTFRGHPAIQIGHFIWQDLSGIHKLLAGCKTDRLPHFLVPESHLRPEIFGPIDDIFPSLKGLVRRTDEAFHDVVPSLYEEHARVIKATAMYVPRALGTAVLAAYKDLPVHHELVERCRNIRDEHEITVLFGLRVGNRTVADMISFGTKMITAICKRFPRVAIIIDGQNSNDNAVYDCFGDKPAGPGSFLHQELDIARVLGNHAEALGCHARQQYWPTCG